MPCEAVLSVAARGLEESPRILQRRFDALSRDYEISIEKLFHDSGYCSGGRRLESLLRWFRYAVERQFLPHYFGGPPAWRMALRARSKPRTLPDFCVIGPAKAGTSDIATTLLLHPCVAAPLAKEIMPREFQRLLAYYPTVREKEARRMKHGISLSPYLTPALHMIELAYKLANLQPQMKIVIVLRDPVRRLYSHWKWELLFAGRQRLIDMTFMQRFDTYAEKAMEVYPMYTACGLEALRGSIYWQAVKWWLDLFGAANVLVLESDEYFGGKADFMYKIQDFVGLPRVEPPSLDKHVNENPLKVPPPGEEIVEKLRKFFRPHNEKLWEVIGKQFDW